MGLRPSTDNGDGTATVWLTQGEVAIIDVEDVEVVDRYTWSLAVDRRGKKYAQASVARGGPKRPTQLHQYLTGMSVPEIDHVDGDGLNCRRSNLRSVTRSQNNMNQRKPRGKHPWKGIDQPNKGGKWRATVRVSGRRIRSKMCDTPEEAAHAYDDLAIEYFGEFASTNFDRKAG